MEAMDMHDTLSVNTSTGGGGNNEYLLEAGYQEVDVSTLDPSSYVFQVVEMPSGASAVVPQEFHGLHNIEFLSGQPNFINVKVEQTYDADVFNPDGTLRIFGYQDAPPIEEHRLPAESNAPPATQMQVGEGEESNQPSHSRSPTQAGFPDGGGCCLSAKEEVEFIGSPVYARIFMDVENPSPKKRSSKIPQALPLQKVSKRKLSDKDQQDNVDEPDEVVVLMNGILTKVGKPSAPASSGKIYSTAQNCPITVKWLLENFESMVGQSLPRSFVYDQYVAHCGLNKIDSVNAASFGKLIRSVFLGLRTRRLGTRGNSKYHYYGIKIKETSHLLPILNSIRAEQDLLNDTVNGRIRKRVRRTQSVYTGKHVKGLVIDKKIEIQESLGSQEFKYPNVFVCKDEELPEGVDVPSLQIFEESYKRHCTRLVEFFHEFKLIDVLAEVANFWRLQLSFKRKGLEDYSSAISKPLLFKITSLEVAEIFVTRMDLYTYQHIINVLVPSLLRPLPLQMLQAVDNMIQDILGMIQIALNGFSKRFVHNKLRSLTAFVRIWKQYSKMSQLSEFVELSLENECSVLTMRDDIKSVQVSHICHRAAMIVESQTMTPEKIFQTMKSFSDTLDMNQSLELWCQWAHKEVMTVVATVKSNSIEDVELVTAEMHSCWLITSNLIVNAIRELCGSESSMFVPLLQWCGELMQYFRQRLLDAMKEVMPMARFHLALMGEDMSINFMDKHKVMPLAATQTEEDPFGARPYIPATDPLQNNNSIVETAQTSTQDGKVEEKREDPPII